MDKKCSEITVPQRTETAERNGCPLDTYCSEITAAQRTNTQLHSCSVEKKTAVKSRLINGHTPQKITAARWK